MLNALLRELGGFRPACLHVGVSPTQIALCSAGLSQSLDCLILLPASPLLLPAPASFVYFAVTLYRLVLNVGRIKPGAVLFLRRRVEREFQSCPHRPAGVA